MGSSEVVDRASQARPPYEQTFSCAPPLPSKYANRPVWCSKRITLEPSCQGRISKEKEDRYLWLLAVSNSAHIKAASELIYVTRQNVSWLKMVNTAWRGTVRCRKGDLELPSCVSWSFGDCEWQEEGSSFYRAQCELSARYRNSPNVMSLLLARQLFRPGLQPVTQIKCFTTWPKGAKKAFKSLAVAQDVVPSDFAIAPKVTPAAPRVITEQELPSGRKIKKLSGDDAPRRTVNDLPMVGTESIDTVFFFELWTFWLERM